MQSHPDKAVAIGINHVALEVGDIDEALEFYSELFEFQLRGKNESMAFIDLGDQFINLSSGRSQTADTKRHFGMVVDNREAVRQAAERLGCQILESPFPGGLDFLDPWGNRLQIVEYASIQFTKDRAVLRGMGMHDLEKTADARRELAEKGMEPEQN